MVSGLHTFTSAHFTDASSNPVLGIEPKSTTIVLARMQRLGMQLDAQSSSYFQDGGKAGVAFP